jgi:predicted RNA methylase
MYNWLLLLIIPLLIALKSLVTQSGFFVPLPMGTVKKILKLADIRKNDVLYDLGCGDGRIIISAAKEYGIKSVGIEKNSFLAWVCRRKIKKNNLEDKVKVIQDDIFNQDLSKATIVVMYLTQKLNDKLKPKLEKELKKGTRVISASHVFKGWKEIKKIRTGHFYTYLYKI